MGTALLGLKVKFLLCRKTHGHISNLRLMLNCCILASCLLHPCAVLVACLLYCCMPAVCLPGVFCVHCAFCRHYSCCLLDVCIMYYMNFPPKSGSSNRDHLYMPNAYRTSSTSCYLPIQCLDQLECRYWLTKKMRIAICWPQPSQQGPWENICFPRHPSNLLCSFWPPTWGSKLSADIFSKCT